MTLEDYLNSLKANPADALSPALLWDDSATLPDELVKASGAWPYVRVNWADARESQALYGKSSIMTGLVDVIIKAEKRPTQANPRAEADKAAVTALWHELSHIPRFVTQLSFGALIKGGFSYATESKPTKQPDQSIMAIHSFSFTYRRN